jgi:hypothetical protein
VVQRPHPIAQKSQSLDNALLQEQEQCSGAQRKGTALLRAHGSTTFTPELFVGRIKPVSFKKHFY